MKILLFHKVYVILLFHKVYVYILAYFTQGIVVKFMLSQACLYFYGLTNLSPVRKWYFAQVFLLVVSVESLVFHFSPSLEHNFCWSSIL